MLSGAVSLCFILGMFSLGIDIILDFYVTSYTHRVLVNVALIFGLLGLLLWHGGK